MKFSEALAAETYLQGPPCSVSMVMEQLDADDKAALTTALASGAQLSAIARALNQIGYRISPHTLGRHRKGDCRCG